MIILSQDEEKIVNFDNVTSIGMVDFTNYISIKAKYQDLYIELGTYKSKERAKEVLKDIIDWVKQESELTSSSDGLSVIAHIKGNVFYMPKE